MSEPMNPRGHDPRGDDASSPDDSRNQAQRLAAAITTRENRRVRMLAVLTVGLWVVAALLIVSIILPALAKTKMAAMNLAEPPDRAITAREVADSVVALLRNVVAIGFIIHGMALLTGMLASISTVMLALTIRRVTLRQVSERLAELSEQLRQSRRAT